MSHRSRFASDLRTNAPFRVPTSTRTLLILYSFLTPSELYARLKTPVQRLRPSTFTILSTDGSTPSRQRALTAALAAPDASTPKPNGAQPHLGQKWCLMTCLLNVYVARSPSGVRRRNLSRGANHSR